MNKSFLIATAVTVGVAITAPAKADRILLHMLGEAEDIGGLAAANAVAGTSVTEGDVFSVTGETIDPASYTCQLMPLLDPASKVQLGSGIDCLYLIQGGVVAVSFFVLPGGEPRFHTRCSRFEGKALKASCASDSSICRANHDRCRFGSPAPVSSFLPLQHPQVAEPI